MPTASDLDHLSTLDPSALGDAGNAAAALQQISLANFIHNMSVPDWGVFLVLCAMSALSWYFIFFHLFRNLRLHARGDATRRAFWAADSLGAAVGMLRSRPHSEPFAAVARAGLDAVSAYDAHDAGRITHAVTRRDYLERALRDALNRASVRLDRGLTTLATIGSSAVYVGLLGTVIGIYYALVGIGAAGESTIAAVAGPVGQALIMTAFGLFAAIPAVLAYNFFARANRVTTTRLDAFAQDLRDVLGTQPAEHEP